MRPLVLLSNDDGYRARGLNLLRDALADWAEVVVCAPETEQSATSHSLSLHRPLRLTEHEAGVFAVDGTPADCVYVALHSERVLDRSPDLVCSGLNHGLNLGLDVFYSGTVAAAREGALKGYPALALSADSRTQLESAARVASNIAKQTLSLYRGSPALLSVNFPPGQDWPLTATRLGHRVYEDGVEFRADPRGREYLWIGGFGVEHRPAVGSDTEAYDAGAVGITPLMLDLWYRDGQERAEQLAEAIMGAFGSAEPTE